VFWASAAAGRVVIGVGLRGIVTNRIDTRPANLAKFVVGGALLHDLLVAPVVLVLAVSAIVVLFSWPIVRADGLATHNPTSLPHNYTANNPRVSAPPPAHTRVGRPDLSARRSRPIHARPELRPVLGRQGGSSPRHRGLLDLAGTLAILLRILSSRLSRRASPARRMLTAAFSSAWSWLATPWSIPTCLPVWVSVSWSQRPTATTAYAPA